MRANALQSGFSMIELHRRARRDLACCSSALLPFFARPLEAMVVGNRTGEIAEHAQRAFARLGQELPTALPNSVRIACSGACLEFIPVLDQADYRALTPGDKLDFAAADDRFDVLMPLAAAPATGLEIVINNQSSASTGQQPRTARTASVTAARSSPAPPHRRSGFTSKLFPAPSARQRFFVVGTPVSLPLRRRRMAGRCAATPATRPRPRNRPTRRSATCSRAASWTCRFTLNDSRASSRSGWSRATARSIPCRCSTSFAW